MNNDTTTSAAPAALTIEDMKAGLAAIVADAETLRAALNDKDRDAGYGLAGISASAAMILEALELHNRRYLAG